jgi:hypothetical protein
VKLIGALEAAGNPRPRHHREGHAPLDHLDPLDLGMVIHVEGMRALLVRVGACVIRGKGLWQIRDTWTELGYTVM